MKHRIRLDTAHLRLISATLIALALLTSCSVTINGPEAPTDSKLSPSGMTDTSSQGSGQYPFEVLFAAQDEELREGECTLLAWRVEGAGDVAAALDGKPVERFGQRQVCPLQTTKYFLEARAGGYSKGSELVVHVSPGEPATMEAVPTPKQDAALAPVTPQPTPAQPPTQNPTATTSSEQPTVINFWADSNNVQAGDCTVLHWHVENVTAVYLDGAGVVGDGATQVCPATNSVYVLHVVRGSASEDRTVTVTVSGAPTATSPGSPPGGGSWGILTADLAITDLIPENLPAGKVLAVVANNGPDDVNIVIVPLNCFVEKTEYVGGQVTTLSAVSTPVIDMPAGEARAYDVGIPLETNKYWYKITCVPQAPFKDPVTNDDYSETIPPPP